MSSCRREEAQAEMYTALTEIKVFCPECNNDTYETFGGGRFCTTKGCDYYGFTVPHNDSVNHPKHYTIHPSGVECIQITEHMNFCLGNALKYIWRAGEKGDAIEDLKKAIWYINREIERLNGREASKQSTSK